MFTTNKGKLILLILVSVLFMIFHLSLSFTTSSSLLLVQQQVSSLVRKSVSTTTGVFAYQTNQPQQQYCRLFSSTFIAAASDSTGNTKIPLKYTTNKINYNRLTSSSSSLLFFKNSKHCSSSSTRNTQLQAASEMNNMDSTTETGVGLVDIGQQQTETVQVDDNNEQEEEEADDDSIPLQSWRQLLEVSIGKSRKIRGSNYVQIATIDTITNEPRCRTVVFRGFVPVKETIEVFSTVSSSSLSDSSTDSSTDSSSSLYMNNNLSCIMKMITDERSQKVNEISNNNNVEMVWWFSKTSEQYRIRGSLLFIGDSTKNKYQYDTHPLMIQLRKSTWGNLSDNAREQFYDSVPGIPFTTATNTTTSTIPVGGRDENNIVLQPPPSNFLVMLLVPKYCDYLRLTNSYRQIDTIENVSSSKDSHDSTTWISTRVNP